MEEAEAALKEIALLLRALAAEEANDASCTKSGSGSKACSDGVERLFAALAQHHHNFTSSSSKPRASNKAATAAVAPAPFEPPAKPQPAPPTSISYAQLRDFLRHHGVHMPLRRFRALVRFIDTDVRSMCVVCA